MKKLLLTLLTALMLNAARAGPVDDALAAYARNDFATVVQIVRPLALKGEAWAQSWLADAYYIGRGVVQDYAEAVRWHRLAAQQGYARAQYNLGNMYSNGQGVVQDYVKAHSWYNLSAIKGDADAVKNRDIVAKRMTSQQIAEAQKMARDCQARNFKGCD